MTDKDIRRFAGAISNVATLGMPREIEDALDEVEMDDLLQAIYNAVVDELNRARELRGEGA